jgi:hypothetical protein
VIVNFIDCFVSSLISKIFGLTSSLIALIVGLTSFSKIFSGLSAKTF